ncbi:MAG: hypothetical protein EKK49_21125, partial [Rhodocyclaceae bacterium]
MGGRAAGRQSVTGRYFKAPGRSVSDCRCRRAAGIISVFAGRLLRRPAISSRNPGIQAQQRENIMSDNPLILSALYRYPVKSMRGERLDASPVSPIGLPFDRHWMVGDPNGRLMTGREYPELVLIDAAPAADGVRLSAPGREPLFVPNTAFTKPHPATVWSDTFSAWHGADEADDWISAYVGARLKFLWIGAETSRHLRNDAAVPLSFADGFPLLLATQASLDYLSARVGRSL